MKASLFENLFLESGSVECETEDYIYSGVCGDLDNIGYDRRECAPCAEKYSVGEIVADAGDWEILSTKKTPSPQSPNSPTLSQ